MEYDDLVVTIACLDHAARLLRGSEDDGFYASADRCEDLSSRLNIDRMVKLGAVRQPDIPDEAKEDPLHGWKPINQSRWMRIDDHGTVWVITYFEGSMFKLNFYDMTVGNDPWQTESLTSFDAAHEKFLEFQSEGQSLGRELISTKDGESVFPSETPRNEPG